MKNLLIICSLLFFGLILRLYNFEDRVTFGSEQARSLHVAANYIKEKPSLLGQEYFRVNSSGHKLFTSAIFGYSLVPLLMIFDFNPLPISYYFAVLNLLTAVVIYILVKKMFNLNVALITFALFLFNSYMIYHSMFIWVLNYMPLIGVLSLYLVWKIKNKKQSAGEVLILGILSGLGFGLQYLHILFIFIILFVLLKYSAQKLKDLLLFIVGGLLGDITQVIFDIRHNFYHLKTLWQYGLDTIEGVSDAGFTYYHFLAFWPLLLLALGLAFYFLYKRSKLLFYVAIIIYIYINLSSNLINFNKPVGMPEGLTLAGINKASELISKDIDNSFNVVALYDFDTRGYVLRYYLKFIYDQKPLSEIDYPSSSLVYALAKKDYDFKNDNPWELNVIKPYDVILLKNLNDEFSIFKIVRKI